jgi:hypothetical protein
MTSRTRTVRLNLRPLYGTVRVVIRPKTVVRPDQHIDEHTTHALEAHNARPRSFPVSHSYSKPRSVYKCCSDSSRRQGHYSPLFSSPLSLWHLRTQMHVCVHPAHRYCSEQEPYPSSRIEAAPFLRRIFAHRTLEFLLLPPLPFALRRLWTLFFLATQLLFPLAFLLCMAQMNTPLCEKEKKGDDPAYRLGTHPSLVEYELRDLLGLGSVNGHPRSFPVSHSYSKPRSVYKCCSNSSDSLEETRALFTAARRRNLTVNGCPRSFPLSHCPTATQS